MPLILSALSLGDALVDEVDVDPEAVHRDASRQPGGQPHLARLVWRQLATRREVV